MSDLDDFLATTLARQVQAEQALLNGDPAPRLAMWSTHDPVTVLGRCAAPADGTRSAGSSAGSGRGSSESWDGTPLDPYTPRQPPSADASTE
jgi:hypothetical protein